MKERQDPEQRVVFSDVAEEPEGAFCLGLDVGMTEHHSLGVACRPRGIEDAGGLA